MKNKFITAALAAVLSLSAAPLALAQQAGKLRSDYNGNMYNETSNPVGLNVGQANNGADAWKASDALNETNKAVNKNSATISAMAAAQKQCNPYDIIGKTEDGWKWTKQVQNGEKTIPTDWKLDESGRIAGSNGAAIQKTTGAELDGKPLNIFAGQS